ncbi:isochorismatase [Corynebacterium sp. TAE3-ERU12]|uniref:phosphopantetheine-binding protein n=1 Tax=Corynebacterium sp. TAE3-ERU12 TaxID=2849491 RepID=UPI001C473AE7|nr:phosphopantetheine-binding protein [Corynebacterium sp. TAE3-ERU12]MBV7294641.1 isochorismatase [Corynebacterium sp. TAE3-ERU12]
MAAEIEQLRTKIANMLDLSPDEISDDADLQDLGMDSVQLMEIETYLQDRDIDIDIADLSEDPRLEAWRELLDS